MLKKVVVFVIFTSTMFHRSLCYSSGAPFSQCESMRPFHGSPPQDGASPYQIRVDRRFYTPGQNVRVSIVSSGDDIRGYLIQARRVRGNSAIGMFAALPINGKFLHCSNRQVKTTTVCFNCTRFDCIHNM
jgi:hypothetical protein